MKKWILVIGLILAQSRSDGATNAYLNYTAAQLNANLALVAAGHASWDLAYGWGNHALAGYLTAESDPAWSAASSSVWSAIGSISPGGYAAISNAAVTAYGWGNHATNSYLGAVEEGQIYAAISNAAPANYAAVSNAALTAVQQIVFNGATNAGPTVNLGSVSVPPVTNLLVYAPNDVSILAGAVTVSGAGTNIANGVYLWESGAGKTAVYRQAAATNMSISYYLSRWWISNGLGTLYRSVYVNPTNEIPVLVWDTSAGPSPAPTSAYHYTTNSLAGTKTLTAGLQTNLAAVSNTVSVVQGWGNHATNGYLQAVTNVSVFSPNSVAVFGVSELPLASGFIVSGAGNTNANGTYTPDGAGYTNAATGAYFFEEEWNAWSIYYGGSAIYWQDNSNYDPWDAAGDWKPLGNGLVFSAQTSTNVLADLTNSVQWVNAPTGSVSTGTARQVAISSDTNQYFYWYSPSAVSGDTTGIWLRVEGQTF